MLNDFGKSQVTIKKIELLVAIKKNRDAHRDIFLKAQIGYRAAAIKELERMLLDARENRPIRRSIEMVEPQEHIKDYTRVISMLEMSTADEIQISEQQFSQYVLDEWGWSNQFTMSNSRYTGG